MYLPILIESNHLISDISKWFHTCKNIYQSRVGKMYTSARESLLWIWRINWLSFICHTNRIVQNVIERIWHYAHRYINTYIICHYPHIVINSSPNSTVLHRFIKFYHNKLRINVISTNTLLGFLSTKSLLQAEVWEFDQISE